VQRFRRSSASDPPFPSQVCNPFLGPIAVGNYFVCHSRTSDLPSCLLLPETIVFHRRVFHARVFAGREDCLSCVDHDFFFSFFYSSPHSSPFPRYLLSSSQTALLSLWWILSLLLYFMCYGSNRALPSLLFFFILGS